MPTFEDLMSKNHVRNHPMFKGFGDRVQTMRANMQRKAEALDLADMFSQQRQVGLGPNDHSIRAYIQEATLQARSALDMCDFPLQPQLSFNNVKNVKMAAHDDSRVVDAEILFNVRICTKSGAVRQALLPVNVTRGEVVPPSTIIYDKQMRVLGQSTVDEIVERNTSYQIPPMRGQFDPPLVGEELDRASMERNMLGWMPREVVTDGDGIRRGRKAQSDGDDNTRNVNPNYQPPAEPTVATDPTMVADPNATKAPPSGYTPDKYAPSASPTDELFRQIMAQPFIVEQIQSFIDSLFSEGVSDQIMQIVNPLMASFNINANDIDWGYLMDELTSQIGPSSGQKAGKVTAATVRKVSFMIAEYMSGRRAFGHRKAAASTVDALTEMQTYLQSAQDTFSPEEYAYYEQLAQEASTALQEGDEQQAKDLLYELENAFEFTDLPEMKDSLWDTFVANCKKAQATHVVKELEVDDDGNKPMRSFMPAGYDLVLEDMVKAEEDGLDTFPRPYSHIERNYILRRFNTCSRDKWLPHLINDGFAINPYGKGPNRGRPTKGAGKQALRSWLEDAQAEMPEAEFEQTGETEYTIYVGGKRIGYMDIVRNPPICFGPSGNETDYGGLIQRYESVANEQSVNIPIDELSRGAAQEGRQSIEEIASSWAVSEYAGWKSEEEVARMAMMYADQHGGGADPEKVNVLVHDLYGKSKAEREVADSTGGGEALDEKIVLDHGLHAGNYDAAYRGGDWSEGLSEQEEAGNPAFDAAYIIGFIAGSSDNWMDDPDYQEAWDSYGKKIQDIGLVADSPYELSEDYND